MTNTEIKKILEEDFSKLETKYGKKIFGLFGYGKINYNIDIKNEKDIFAIAFYIPSFEDLYYEVKNTKDIKIGEHSIAMIDIRDLEKMLQEQDLCAFEILSTSNYIINRKYEAFFNKIIDNRDNLFIDKRKIISNFEHDYNYYKNVKKDLFMAIRLSLSCELYYQGESFENCISFKKDYLKQYLNSIIDGKMEPDTEEIDHNFEKMQYSLVNVSVSDIVKVKDFIHNVIVDVISCLSEEEMTEEEFKSTLTKMEQDVFEAIMKEIDYREGNVSISQLIEKHNISRPVFKNVIQKMKDNGIAEVDIRGAKGTFVRVMNTNFYK